MRRITASAAMFALVATLAGSIAPVAFGDGASAPQASAIERLVRQEDARKADLARYDATARQNDLATVLDARERAMVARPETLARGDRFDLDPAIRAAMIARAAVATPTVVDPAPSAQAGFAWGAAALGLGVGVAGMCVLLGCVTLVRHDGRLRSA